jgi:hypothetical protein
LAIEVAAARLGVRSVAQMHKESQDLMNMLAGVERMTCGTGTL